MISKTKEKVWLLMLSLIVLAITLTTPVSREVIPGPGEPKTEVHGFPEYKDPRDDGTSPEPRDSAPGDPGGSALSEVRIHQCGEDLCETIRDVYLTYPEMSGEDILGYQRVLAELGYYPGALDGIYDKGTALAVESFQKALLLPTDGRINAATLAALAKTYEKNLPEADLTPKVEQPNQPPVPPATPDPKSGSKRILINLYNHTLTLLVDGQPYKAWPVAVGKKQTRSPIGEWKVVNKGIWGNGFGTRWMGLNVAWGTYGIHGTNKPWSIGTAASHGCFRMLNKHVEELYPLVPHGTPVDVVGNLYLFYQTLPGSYCKGSRSQGVVAIQLRLRQLGYIQSRADGIYGSETEAAVKLFQRLHGLAEDGVVSGETKKLLGL